MNDLYYDKIIFLIIFAYICVYLFINNEDNHRY